jgi:GNAT superfamily N-acetyltransferase
MSLVAIRPATEHDLPVIYDIYYRNEVRGESDPPPRGAIPAWLPHTLATGTLLIAERGGVAVGYAGLTRRDDVSFLTDLFVHPEMQAGGIGGALLRAILPVDGSIRCTFASSDPRALALYIRAGMRPQWPQFWLRAVPPAPRDRLHSTVEVVEARPDDFDLVVWEREVGGRQRREDIVFWVRVQRAVPLWFRRGSDTIGYGYVRLAAGTLRHPEAGAIGPLGVRDARDAADCALAAAIWARGRAAPLHIAVPGPHPALASLLEAGFAITDMDTFVSSAAMPHFDPRRYISSGGDLC